MYGTNKDQGSDADTAGTYVLNSIVPSLSRAVVTMIPADKIQILPLRRPRPPPPTKKSSEGGKLAGTVGKSAGTDGAAQKKTSGRIGQKKVKSGCLTCKIRRVKCDEAKVKSMTRLVLAYVY